MPSVKADRIIDQWATIVEQAAGKGEHIYTVLDTELTKANIPQVTWSRGEVNMGMMTRGREFLIIKNAGLREYTMYVHARDVGAHLDCGWFLTIEPGASIMTSATLSACITEEEYQYIKRIGNSRILAIILCDRKWPTLCCAKQA
jgi:hypothetical protein